MTDALYVIMRWLHIASAVTLVGGIVFGRFVLTRAAGALAPDARETFLDRAAATYQPLAFASMAGLLVSGLYNIFTIPGHTPLYHALLGVKLLLVMHIFAIAILMGRPHNPRRARMMTGAAISGFIVIAIANYLRHIF
jgi:putative copper export protein